MLAFLATTFKVPGRRIPYGWVVEQLGRTYVKVTPSIVEQDRSLGLWVLMIAAFTVTNSHDWVRGAWEMASSGADWVAVKKHLMQVMWIESIHDKLGQMVFKELKRLEII
jgi:hypothetical protein